MASWKVALLLLALSACKAEPVLWSSVVYQNVPPQPRDEIQPIRALPAHGCHGSLRVVKAGHFSYGAWWRARSDSSVVLLVSRMNADQRWEEPVVADSTDAGTRGCSRFPPAIAADSASGYVHLGYFLEPNSGAGIFFAHSMDSADTFHAAVPIVYGNNISRVSIASGGDRVAVAYEDPNSEQPVIGIALSRTMGHLFEDRARATSSNGRARQPVVRVAGDSIRLWWSEYSANPAVSATRSMYRAGLWQ